jgi:hypothetical protein
VAIAKARNEKTSTQTVQSKNEGCMSPRKLRNRAQNSRRADNNALILYQLSTMGIDPRTKTQRRKALHQWNIANHNPLNIRELVAAIAYAWHDGR